MHMYYLSSWKDGMNGIPQNTWDESFSLSILNQCYLELIRCDCFRIAAQEEMSTKCQCAVV